MVYRKCVSTIGGQMFELEVLLVANVGKAVAFYRCRPKRARPHGFGLICSTHEPTGKLPSMVLLMETMDAPVPEARSEGEPVLVGELGKIMVLQDLLKRIFSGMVAYDDTWLATRSKLLSIYEKALSSNSTNLVHMIESIQEELLAEDKRP
ncbi:hypothetical protein M8C21_006211 [Ambrosia artemisiifolia]|uniref:Uncharacterized protein n=1 Tax=Ambrosia artemisiifolia TaxID=4212 RepID=A0AAD5D3Y3_AMBAR|nr:hypothetical protein M8C21_006211 [Ambrosia artemisiifolia]